MVAKSGHNWQLADSVESFIDQLDALYPNRDRRSDGSIGDLAHRARRSDHNPDSNGYVWAVDFDNNVAPGVDAWSICQMIAARVKSGQEKRVKYLVSGDPRGANTDLIFSKKWFVWAWRKKDSNDHRGHHGHISGVSSIPFRTDRSNWFGKVTPEQPIPPVPTPTIKDDDNMLLIKAPDGKTYPMYVNEKDRSKIEVMSCTPFDPTSSKVSTSGGSQFYQANFAIRNIARENATEVYVLKMDRNAGSVKLRDGFTILSQ
jgi:hypothetical protein